ncbi:glutamate decarboxylase [Helicobacter ailurogastricus]|uniref:Glutamate decarboxylase n=1 Tax=Helicobacter ailurogastricus TaxID=1578720 RepID=A0A0K2X795_9HELI|nr:glutamate decarboxylase [Helicobacter ailurogastricus]CRF40589.1 Glutamate decarboxylase [Helicobacter ailurogastricus]CRF42243.1 Glutamate decarboxylase [Helicobacter ailurogastricus]CRF44683.1 Glutamate decarboxylase [Helicobacter ailurogastricus]
MLHKKSRIERDEEKFVFKADNSCTPIFGSIESDVLLPRDTIGQKMMDPRIAYQLVADEMMHDGNPRYNLCTFVQTYMEEEARKIMLDSMATNAIDKSEYPQTTEIEKRCVNIIANLWNANPQEDYMGTSTVGSSEACMLGGMAMKFRWRKRAQELGIDTAKKKPNLIVSSGYQVVWEKFCVYWDIELREVPLSDFKNLTLDPKKAIELCDDYTIGIVPIMGITYTGGFDDIIALDKLLSAYNQTAKISVPIHVDAASGGLYLPFMEPNLAWDFRLKNVASISTSGHKYGLVYPGIGWVLWRDKEFLPEELIFKVAYLGDFEPTFQINFSRSGSQIWAQYYCFVRWGFEGYKAVHAKTRDVGLFLAKGIKSLGLFEMINEGQNIPIVCWAMSAKVKEKKQWDLYDLADRLRFNGWQVPAYPLPANFKEVSVMRVVVRADQSMEQMSLFLKDLKQAIKELDAAHIARPKRSTQGGAAVPVGYVH